jgi:hypothetical protein
MNVIIDKLGENGREEIQVNGLDTFELSIEVIKIALAV